MTNYYVKNGGSDSANGQSDTNAWATIGKVNSFSFSTEDCVYFKCGDTWNTKTDATLYIDWSGTDDDNRAVVGAYYMDGSETVGVNEDGKPLFDGDWDTTQAFQRIIVPYAADYVTVQDLSLYNSYAFGVDTITGYAPQYLTVSRLKVDYMGRSGIFIRVGQNALVEYCDVGRVMLRRDALGTWDGAIIIKKPYGTVRYCHVHEAHGEGINFADGDYMLAEYNVLWSIRSVAMYTNANDSIIRHNIIIGTDDTTYHGYTAGGRGWNPVAIGINQEAESLENKRSKYYGNVAIGSLRGFQALNLSGLEVDWADRNYCYNNTFIDNYTNLYVHPTECLPVEFKNNLSVVFDDGVHPTGTGNGHVTFKTIGLPACYVPLGTCWCGTGSDDIGDWENETYDVVGDADLYKTSGWQAITEASDIDIAASVAIGAESDAIDTAQDAGDSYDDIMMVGCDFNTTDASSTSTPIVVVLGDQDDEGEGWDFGAYLYTSGDPGHTAYSLYRGISRAKPIFGARRSI